MGENAREELGCYAAGALLELAIGELGEDRVLLSLLIFGLGDIGGANTPH
jgi:hypothetical protein